MRPRMVRRRPRRRQVSRVPSCRQRRLRRLRLRGLRRRHPQRCHVCAGDGAVMKTRAGKSSQSIAAIRVNPNAILPAVDDWTPLPLVPQWTEPMTVHPETLEWMTWSVDTADARAAKRLIRELEAA